MPYTAGSAQVVVTPDLTGWHRKIGEFLKQEDATWARAGDKWGAEASKTFAARFDPKAKIKPDVDATRAKIQIDELTRNRAPKVAPKVEDRVAGLELDRLARNRTVEVKVKTDTSALSKLGKLGSAFGGAFGAPGGASFLAPGTLGGLAVAVPLLEAGATEATALASGLAAAGLGAASFGALAMPAFKSITGAYSKIKADQAAYDNALTKTARNTALSKLHQDLASLDPAQRQALRGLQGLTGEYGKLSKAFEPKALAVFNDGLKLAGTLLPDLVPFANTFATDLDKMLKKADGFAQSKGFKSFLGQLGQIEKAALPALGQGLAKLVPDVEKFFTIFSKKDVVTGIDIAFGALDLAFKAVDYSVNRLRTNWDSFWSTSQKVFYAAAPPIIRGVQWIADAALGGFKSITHAAAIAWGWVPGLGGKLKSADRALGSFKASADANFSAASRAVNGWKASYERAPKVARLKGDIADLQRKLSSARAGLRNPDLTKTRRARIEATIAQLQAQIARARAALNAINGKVATTYIDAVRRTFYTPGKGGHVPGTGYASGTPSAPRGWAWVGERGPELMRFTGGETVLPHGLSVAASSARGFADGLNVPVISAPALPRVGGDGASVRLTIGAAGNDQLLQAIVRSLRAEVHSKTQGDVQALLGKGRARV